MTRQAQETSHVLADLYIASGFLNINIAIELTLETAWQIR